MVLVCAFCLAAFYWLRLTNGSCVVPSGLVPNKKNIGPMHAPSIEIPSTNRGIEAVFSRVQVLKIATFESWGVRILSAVYIFLTKLYLLCPHLSVPSTWNRSERSNQIPLRRPLRSRQADGDLPSCGDWFCDCNSIHALVWQHLWCSRLLQLGLNNKRGWNPNQ